MTELTVSTMDQEKLKKAAINNLDAERSVGSINYELGERGAKNLNSASRNHVISKALPLTKDKSVDTKFREMERKKVMPAIVEAWNRKQEQLSKEGLSTKEAQNVVVDRRRNLDLSKLKEKGGPFVSSEEVKDFLASELSEKDKVARLYLEVRYSRDTTLSFPKNSDIFRLKRDHRNLDSSTYGANLIIFLDKVTFRNSVAMEDFEAALERLT